MSKTKLEEKGRSGLDINRIRQDFPILKRTVHGKPLIYLDNAATSQKPSVVIDALVDYYRNYNANVHRALHELGEEAGEKFEAVRRKTADFINSKSIKEIIFTRNATEAINLVAYAFGGTMKKGDEIITTIMEHHSNIVPWQMLAARGVKLKFVDIDAEGHLKMEQYDELITKNTKLVAVTHASNVLGTINDVKEITKIAHEHDALILVDGAQSAPHMKIDVQDIDCDFFACSSHKMLGPTGIGVLYGKKHIMEEMPPFLMGGDMIKEVYKDRTIFNGLPNKFEAGTPDIGCTIAFGAALDYMNRIGMDNIRKHEIYLTRYALENVGKIGGIKIHGPVDANEKTGVISFNLADVHPHDIASILDEDGIAIRSGHSCAMPLMQKLGVNSVARASFHVYNTAEEIDALVNGLKKAKSIFRV